MTIEIKHLTFSNTEDVINFIKQFSSKFDPEKMIEHWKKQMLKDGYAFGAFDVEHELKLVGSMGGRLQLPYGTIDYMFIHPLYQNSGIGNQLLGLLENYLSVCGVKKILTSNEQELSLFLLGNGYSKLEDGTKIKELQNV